MKTKLFILLFALMSMLVSCGTTQYVMEDDIYFNPKDIPAPILVSTDTIKTNTVDYSDEEFKTVINNYYDVTDYNNSNLDFAFRIKTFHNTRYYDPFYWNSWNYNYYWDYSYNY